MAENELKDMSDHDILISMHRDVCWMKKILSNHLKHHWVITVSALGTASTFGVGFLFLLIRFFVMK